MILEVADIRIAPGRQAEFERAVHHGIQDVIARSRGFRGYQVRHGIESPERYLLLLEWETLEDHTVGFRGSADYAQWRSIVADFFAQPPYVEHFELASAPAAGQRLAADRPIEGLSACHVDIVHMLAELTALARRQTPADQRREAAGRMLRFFDEVVAVHHREEEAELFPAVLADATAGDEHANVEGMVARLIDDHRRVEGCGTRLAPTLAATERGQDVALDESAVDSLATDYLAHARFEEDVFLPLARAILGRNSDHMAALGLALHIRRVSDDLRQRFASI